jgi:hypothetical protein
MCVCVRESEGNFAKSHEVLLQVSVIKTEAQKCNQNINIAEGSERALLTALTAPAK